MLNHCQKQRVRVCALHRFVSFSVSLSTDVLKHMIVSTLVAVLHAVFIYSKQRKSESWSYHC
jgi:hypothetical protein